MAANKVDISNIEKVYSGKAGCMCGCKGKYSYNEGSKFESWQADGPNVKSVQRVANKVLNHPDRNEKESSDYTFVEDQHTGHIWVVYFRK